MANPFIIFLDPKRDVGAWQCPFDLPVGVKADGNTGDPRKEASDYLILILDDTEDVPRDLVHKNVHVATQLLVLKHTGSVRNSDPEHDEQLLNFGRPRVIDGFHHQPYDQNFNRIKQLLKQEVNVADFLAIYKTNNEASALIELASVCQLIIIDPTLEDSPDWNNKIEPIVNAALTNVPPAIADRFINFVDRTTGMSLWSERLSLIKKRAEEIL